MSGLHSIAGGLLLPLFRWLGQTPVGVLMNQTRWAFAWVEVVHVLALAVFGGALLTINLGLMGVWLKGRAPRAFLRNLGWPLFGGLATLIVSGTLLVASAPLRYYANLAFRFKLSAIVLALAATLVLYFARPDAKSPSLALGSGAALALALWLAVAVGGRWIGLL